MSSIDPDVRRLALSTLLLGFVGPVPPRWLLDGLADGVGGLVLFGSNLGDGTDVRALTDRLRAAAGRDLVLATDEEGGDVTRLDTVRGSASPGAAALGHLDEPAVTEEVYAALANRLSDAGITMNLAPVADVNLAPANPVIGVRSFSADPEVAARHVAAAVRGTQRGGVAACVKHFPGHGATESDTHHEVAVLHRTREQLTAAELLPFAAAVGAGVQSVMTGHLVVPDLDPDNLATVSPATTALLRDELGYVGPIVTDAIEMKALSGSIGMVAGFVAAIRAGADVVETGALDYPDLVELIPRAVHEAIEEGSLDLSRLQEASRRAATLAHPTTLAAVDESAFSELGTRCLETTGRLPSLDRPLVVECRTPNNMATGELPWSVAERARAALPGSDVLIVDGPVSTDDVLARASGRSLVVVVRDPVRHTWQQAVIDAAAAHSNAVVVDVGWPAELPAVPVIRTRGIAPDLLAAAVAVLVDASLGAIR